MYKAQCIFLFSLSCFIIKSSAGTVPSISPCTQSDKKCQVTNVQKSLELVSGGISEIGLNATDPILIPFIRADQPNLKLSFRDLKIYSLDRAKVLDVEHDPQKQTIILVLNTPFYVTGQYDLKAKLSFIEVVGNGDFESSADIASLTILLKYEDIEQNGTRYWNIIGYDYNFGNVDKVSIKFDNLFGGDQNKAKPFTDIIKNNANEAIKEIGIPIFTEVTPLYISAMKKLFLAVPANEIIETLRLKYYV